MKTHDFLLELGTEELPPKLLVGLSNSLKTNIINELEKLDISFAGVSAYATPRRLAVSISKLQSQQEEQIIEKKGPSIDSPEMAIKGFSKSCGVDLKDLEKRSIGNKQYYFYLNKESRKSIKELLPLVIESSINNIPITRAMKWGSSDYSFVRPVHWLIIMLDNEVVPATIMGLKSGNITKGLRSKDSSIFSLPHAKGYESFMSDNTQIEVDFNKRKELIRQQVLLVAKDNNAEVIIDESLLDEVCALVEIPKAFLGKFDERFLAVPEEAIISAMKSHQKYFHLFDKKSNLLPFFISVANGESNNIETVIKGNERVIHPRLSDSEFFWNRDKEVRLDARMDDLDNVLFMKSLGSMAEKVKRIEYLSSYIANLTGFDAETSSRAGLLSKSDLISEMVGEFADLQGIMGSYYALNDGESDSVAIAIKEHYQPRFSGDKLPSTSEGLVVSIADKIDTISGVYGIGQAPTGSKDPYALRRLALGLLRILLEAKIEINLKKLIDVSLDLHLKDVDRESSESIYQFMMDRLKAYYKDANIDGTIYEAVLAVSPESPFDFHQRVEALSEFTKKTESDSLIESNKRIANILKDFDGNNKDLNSKMLLEDAEQKLFKATELIAKQLSNKKDYKLIMESLLNLKDDIDSFFETIMVNVEDPDLRTARLMLISRVRGLFLSVADISFLSS